MFGTLAGCLAESGPVSDDEVELATERSMLASLEERLAALEAAPAAFAPECPPGPGPICPPGPPGPSGPPGPPGDSGTAGPRTIARVHGVTVNDPTDSGPIATRVLPFTKTADDTGVRVAYTDNWHAGGSVSGCRWEIRIDGASCADPTSLVYDRFSLNDSNFAAGSVFGTCFGIPAGEHIIQVYVGPMPGWTGGDCDTGWTQGYWALEAEEVY